MNMLESVISIFAPHNCVSCGLEGTVLCDSCWPKIKPSISQCYICQNPTYNYQLCEQCKPNSNLQAVWIRTQYKGIPKHLVKQLKFERLKSAADVIASAMAELFPVDYQPVIVPVPTASSRRRQRGYDQTVLIARSLAKQLNLQYAPVLVRIGQSRQVGTNKQERRQQMNEAFRTRNISRLEGKQVLLVDDVLTTGSTIEAAANALKNSGIDCIDAAVFSRA